MPLVLAVFGGCVAPRHSTVTYHSDGFGTEARTFDVPAARFQKLWETRLGTRDEPESTNDVHFATVVHDGRAIRVLWNGVRGYTAPTVFAETNGHRIDLPSGWVCVLPFLDRWTPEALGEHISDLEEMKRASKAAAR